MLFKYITYNKEILDGKAIIANSRISVELIMEWLAGGASIISIYELYPHLPAGSIEEAILYAAQFSRNEIYLQEAI